MGVGERCIVGLEEVVRGRLMRERRHGRVAIPGSRGGVVQAGVNGRYASRWVPVFVVGVCVRVGVRVVEVVLRLCVRAKVDLHDSGEIWRLCADRWPVSTPWMPQSESRLR